MRNNSFIAVFTWGCIISFFGSLPLSPLNLITTYLSVSDGVYAGLVFALGCIISELIFVRLLLLSLNWLGQRKKLFKIIEWVTIVVILILAVFSIRAALLHTGFSSAMPASIKSPFISGIIISALDPTKVPFWFLWSTYLMGIGFLPAENKYYNFYIPGIGLGSLFGFLVFIFGGSYLIHIMRTHQDIINWAIGIILLGTVVIQIYRAFKSPNYIRVTDA